MAPRRPAMPIPDKVRNRQFYFTADELPEDAKVMLGKMLTVQLQQEKEHGLGVSNMLESIGIDPTEYIKDAESSITAGDRKLDYFRMRMEDWVERTLTRVLAERTGAIQTIAGLGTWFVPLAVWHAKNYGDEAMGHTVQGVLYTRDLVAQGRAEECQRAIDKFYGQCLDIFGGVDTANERKYLEA